MIPKLVKSFSRAYVDCSQQLDSYHDKSGCRLHEPHEHYIEIDKDGNDGDIEKILDAEDVQDHPKSVSHQCLSFPSSSQTWIR